MGQGGGSHSFRSGCSVEGLLQKAVHVTLIPHPVDLCVSSPTPQGCSVLVVVIILGGKKDLREREGERESAM